MRRYSTVQAAAMLGIHQPSLQRLIRQKRIPVPPMQKVGGIRVRLWSDADVERARKAMQRK
jgi:predicted DNA-binding transcriptional regulator AlpA